MTPSAPEAPADSDHNSARAPGDSTQTALDSVFTSPSRHQWKEAALAGLGQDTSLQTLAYETLEGLSLSVLYDTLPSHAELTNVQRGGERGWDNRVAIPNMIDTNQANSLILTALGAGNSSVQVSISKETDLHALLNGVMLDVAPVSLRAANDYTSVAVNIKDYVESLNVDVSAAQFSFNADPIGEWLTQGTLNSSVEEAINKLGHFAAQTSTSFPSSKAVLVDVTVHHNAGASATQELHAALATATLYLEQLVSTGMSLDEAARQIVFQMSCDTDVLMSVIKLRSLASLWQHLVRQMGEAFKTVPATPVPQLTLVAETSRRHLSRLDHWNNHLRNMSACTAAAMGNATSIIVHPHDRIDDWQASSDTSLGERMARNLPIILEREAGLTRVTDPLAGSHAIETLTSELVELTWQSLARMNNAASWLHSITTGGWQNALAETHTRRVARLANKQQTVVGVNRYTVEDDPSASPLKEKNTQLKTPSLKLERVRDSESFEMATAASVHTSDNMSAH